MCRVIPKLSLTNKGVGVITSSKSDLNNNVIRLMRCEADMERKN